MPMSMTFLCRLPQYLCQKIQFFYCFTRYNGAIFLSFWILS
ncbi:hypothetical protein ENHAE0001_0326 [Enhydrobacter aerosaccus SK60]|nr:hypothetical protein ENHAE0001_0326 [Enhydrobacter aerosaccus SK60]